MWQSPNHINLLIWQQFPSSLQSRNSIELVILFRLQKNSNAILTMDILHIIVDSKQPFFYPSIQLDFHIQL